MQSVLSRNWTRIAVSISCDDNHYTTGTSFIGTLIVFHVRYALPIMLIIKGFRTIVFIFIVISTTFRPIYPPAFFRCLSNSVTFTELRTTSFIESTGVACSDSVSHNRVQVLSIPVLLLACRRGFNKGRSSKFREGSRVRQTPEEGRKTYRPKCCGNNNKDEENPIYQPLHSGRLWHMVNF